MFENIENKKTYQEIVFQIQDLILSGQLKKGDLLPPERELAERLSVSRNSLREALKALTIMGLIDSKQGKGNGNTISANMDLGLYTPLSLLFKLNNNDIYDVLSLRYILEIQIVKIISHKCVKADFAPLRKIVENTKDVTDFDRLLQLELDFHYELSKLTENSMLIYFMQAIHYLIQEQIALAHKNTANPDEVYTNHKIILEALENKDIDKALNELIFGFEDSFPNFDFTYEKYCL